MIKTFDLAVAVSAVSVLAGCVSSTEEAAIGTPERTEVAIPWDAIGTAPGERVDTERFLAALAPVTAEHGGFGLHYTGSGKDLAENELPSVARRTSWKQSSSSFKKVVWFAPDEGASLFLRRNRSSRWFSESAGAWSVDRDGRIAFDAQYDLYTTLFRRENGSLACQEHAPERPHGEKDHLKSCRVTVEKPTCSWGKPKVAGKIAFCR